MAKTWIGKPPSHCELCGNAIVNVFIDGRTSRGPWAHMCVKCHGREGTGLGTGKGQQYEKQTIDKSPGTGETARTIIVVEWHKVQG